MKTTKATAKRTAKPTITDPLAAIAADWARIGVWLSVTPSTDPVDRPAAWLLRHVPELRVRALVGPSLESDLVTLALAGPSPLATSPAPPVSPTLPRTGPPIASSPAASYFGSARAPGNFFN